jgi:orotate phosphoribosyltransferase
MKPYKTEFIDFMLACDVLRFGSFTTKSGRQTPFFINTGAYDTGEKIARLGEFYATALAAQGSSFDNLYGPAYKGIPLVVTVSIALQRSHAQDRSFTFNRKEAKDHGEGGSLVGHRYQGGEQVVIVEDVMTAGTSIHESVPIISSAADNVSIVGIMISVDRQEQGPNGRPASAEILDRYNIPVWSIVSLSEIVEYLGGNGTLDAEQLAAIAAYREKWGSQQT